MKYQQMYSVKSAVGVDTVWRRMCSATDWWQNPISWWNPKQRKHLQQENEQIGCLAAFLKLKKIIFLCV